MRLLNYLAKNATVLNALLLALIVGVLVFTLSPLFRVKVALNMAPAQEAAPVTEEKPTAGQVPSLSEFMVVAERNLFHPERRIPPEKAEKELPRPEIVLYGTVMAGDMSLAYIEDKKSPYSTPGRGKRQLTVKKGDSVSGFIVKEIQANKITLVRGDESMTALLDDAKKVRGEEATRGGVGMPTPGSIPTPGSMPTAGISARAATPSPAVREMPAPVAPTSARLPLNDRRTRDPRLRQPQ